MKIKTRNYRTWKRASFMDQESVRIIYKLDNWIDEALYI